MITIKGGLVDIKMWTDGVPVESGAIDQLRNLSTLPFVHKHIAVMPDVHIGIGATVGSVIATKNAIIPSCVSVDIGCGMNAVRLSLKSHDLPDSLKTIRAEIEKMVPVGQAEHTIRNLDNKHHAQTKMLIDKHYSNFKVGLDIILSKNPDISKMVKTTLHEKAYLQTSSLGSGNHYVELCVDENHDVWVMLHSGSRGVGNAIGRYFIEKAKEEMITKGISLVDKDLAYLDEGTKSYQDYIEAVEWAQNYAFINRQVMMDSVLVALRRHLPTFIVTKEAINCHHNYISTEFHFGEWLHITRKGAVRAAKGDYGIIPGSMGAKSFIVEGKGCEDSFCSCSHGAGRVMSRSQAKKMISVADHEKATAGVECRKDEGVLDESPAAYKNIEHVMNAQSDLVSVVHTLKQVLCVKG